MRQRFICLLVLTSLLVALVLPFIQPTTLFAQDAIPEPFCGELDAEDCDILRQSNDAMLKLDTYTASVEYKLIALGIPDIAPEESGFTFRIDSRYAFDDAARASMRFFAVQSREDPLAATKTIEENPALLIDLYRGMNADLNFTLDVNKAWAETLSDSGEMITWPETTHIAARLVDGVIYIDIHELKGFIPSLAEMQDWVALDLVKLLEELANRGVFRELAADVAASSTGRSVWGLDPAMLNLITSMRSVFGRPKSLEPFMEIRRRKDVELEDQKGAAFQIDFATLDFILSEKFRDLLMQAVEVAAASQGEEVNRDDLSQMVDLFWLFAPAIFRDLEIGGTYTIGLEDQYQYAGETVIHWDLLAVLRAVGQIAGEEMGGFGDEVYIDFITSTKNSGFNAPFTLNAPADVQWIPPEDLIDLEALGYESFAADGETETSETVVSETVVSETVVSETVKTGNHSGTPPATKESEVALPTGDPSCDEALATAWEAFHAENYATVVSEVSAVITMVCAASAEAHQLLGAGYYKQYEQIYHSQGADQADPDDVYRAVTFLSKAIELDHGAAHAFFYRGLAFESFGNYGHAVDDLTRAAELAPDDPYPYFPLGRIYAELGQTEEAIDAYQTFLDLYSEDDEWVKLAEEKLAELEK